ncbi:MAG: hypothetical protein GY909_11235 [Oligoflexia bacterium]|nr:hypothetical protein [Oligoflexia bacterium]
MNLEKLDKKTHSFDSLLSQSLEIEVSKLETLDQNAVQTAIGFGPLIRYSDNSIRFDLTNSLGFNHPLLLKWYFDEDNSFTQINQESLDSYNQGLRALGENSIELLPFIDLDNLSSKDAKLIEAIGKLFSLEEFMSETGRLGEVNDWINNYFHQYKVSKNKVSIEMPHNDFESKLRDNGVTGILKKEVLQLTFPLLIKEEHIKKVAHIVSEIKDV